MGSLDCQRQWVSSNKYIHILEKGPLKNWELYYFMFVLKMSTFCVYIDILYFNYFFHFWLICYQTYRGTTTFAEIDCKGPGADTSKRVSWTKKLSSSYMEQFSFASFINMDGWVDNLPTIS